MGGDAGIGAGGAGNSGTGGRGGNGGDSGAVAGRGGTGADGTAGIAGRGGDGGGIGAGGLAGVGGLGGDAGTGDSGSAGSAGQSIGDGGAGGDGGDASTPVGDPTPVFGGTGGNGGTAGSDGGTGGKGGSGGSATSFDGEATGGDGGNGGDGIADGADGGDGGEGGNAYATFSTDATGGAGGLGGSAGIGGASGQPGEPGTGFATIHVIPVGNNPFWAAVSPDGTTAYVTNSSSGTISVIDTDSYGVIETIATGGQPTGVAFAPDGSKAYATNSLGSVLVIDTTDYTVTSVPSAGSLYDVAVTPADTPQAGRAYFTSPGGVSLPQIPDKPTYTVTTTLNPGDSIQAAIDAAQAGDVIFLNNGTYSMASALNINKSVYLVGQSQAGVVIEDTRGNAESFVSVSADDVMLDNLTIRQVTNATAIGTAITVSGSGYPATTRLDNFRMYDVTVQYSKAGLSIRSDNYVVQGNTFQLVAGSSGTRRGLLVYGNGGDSFIADNVFVNNLLGQALRAVNLTSTTGINPGDDLAGSLTIEDSTFTGAVALSQFVNIDNFQGDPGAFELIVNGNVTNETNAFIVTVGGTQNYGDVFSRVVLMGNTLTNNHGSGGGKGVFGIDGTGAQVSFRSSDLPVIAGGNVLGQLAFRAGWAQANGSVGSIVGYSTAQITTPTVDLTSGAEPGIRYLDTATNDVFSPPGLTGVADVGNSPQQIVIAPDGTRAYYSANGSAQVRMINTATNTVDAVIGGVGASPRGLAVKPDGSAVYVVSNTGLSVIDADPGSGTYNSVIGAIPVGPGGQGVVFSPDGTRAYVTSQGVDGAVLVIDTDPGSGTYNTVVRTINLGVGEKPSAVAVSPDGNTLYVTSNPASPGKVWAIAV